MTKPIRWPNKARDARDKSADFAAVIAKKARQMRDEITDVRVREYAWEFFELATAISRLLEREGAGTTPDYRGLLRQITVERP